MEEDENGNGDGKSQLRFTAGQARLLRYFLIYTFKAALSKYKPQTFSVPIKECLENVWGYFSSFPLSPGMVKYETEVKERKFSLTKCLNFCSCFS